MARVTLQNRAGVGIQNVFGVRTVVTPFMSKDMLDDKNILCFREKW